MQLTVLVKQVSVSVHLCRMAAARTICTQTSLFFQVYRKLEDMNDDFGGNSPIRVIANSDTEIPKNGTDEAICVGVKFGSTASPSIAGEWQSKSFIFANRLASDSENSPHLTS